MRPLSSGGWGRQCKLVLSGLRDVAERNQDTAWRLDAPEAGSRHPEPWSILVWVGGPFAR